MTGDFSGARVLITGGLGFIGSTTARELVEQGASVTIVDNLLPGHGGNAFNIEDFKDAVQVEILDIRDTDRLVPLIRTNDILLNLAAQTSHWGSMEDPLNDLSINTVAQGSLLESCRRENPDIKVIYASTRQVYGRPDYVPVNEQHPVRPVDVNGIAKHAGEDLHLLYHRVHGLRTGVVRLSNTYGPRMRVKDAQQMFLGVWIRMLLHGETITVFGDGSQERDLVFVDDCVAAILLAASSETATGRVFNVGRPQGVTLAHLAALLVALEEGGRWELVPFPAQREIIDIGSYTTDAALIEMHLGWRPAVSLEVGLGETVDYYRRFGHHYWDIDT